MESPRLRERTASKAVREKTRCAAKATSTGLDVAEMCEIEGMQGIHRTRETGIERRDELFLLSEGVKGH